MYSAPSHHHSGAKSVHGSTIPETPATEGPICSAPSQHCACTYSVHEPRICRRASSPSRSTSSSHSAQDKVEEALGDIYRSVSSTPNSEKAKKEREQVRGNLHRHGTPASTDGSPYNSPLDDRYHIMAKYNEAIHPATIDGGVYG